MANKKNLSMGVALVLIVAAFFGLDLNTNKLLEQASSSATQVQHSQSHKPATKKAEIEVGLDLIGDAYDRKQSNVQVHAAGTVKAVLRDDNEGSPHQKFILELNTGQTVLVAHNIDLAPRIEVLQKGDQVEFFGEYEYSAQGGVIHWTHHDPQRNHIGGWLKHKNKTYE